MSTFEDVTKDIRGVCKCYDLAEWFFNNQDEHHLKLTKYPSASGGYSWLVQIKRPQHDVLTNIAHSYVSPFDAIRLAKEALLK